MPCRRRRFARSRSGLLKEIGVLPDLSLVTMTQEEVREDLTMPCLARSRRRRGAPRPT